MIRPLTAACLALPLLAACATPADADSAPKGVAKYADDARLGPQTDRICFPRNIDGFSQNTRDTVVLDAGSKEYLVEVSSCYDLRNAQSIALDSPTGCVTRNDIILVSTSAFSLNDGGISPDRCFLRAIYEWDKDAADEAGE